MFVTFFRIYATPIMVFTFLRGGLTLLSKEPTTETAKSLKIRERILITYGVTFHWVVFPHISMKNSKIIVKHKKKIFVSF